MKTPRWLMLCGALVALSTTLFVWWYPGTIDFIVLALEWISDAGWQGAAAYALVHLVCCLTLIPASIAESGGGYAYGLWWGWPLTTLISVGNATVAFVIGRYLIKPLIGRHITRTLGFRALNDVVKRQGVYIVTLLRLSPVAPFNVISYGMGLTGVSLRDYMIGTWLGSIPTLFFFVYLGSTVASASDLTDGATTPLWARWTGVLITLMVTVLVTRTAQRALHDAIRKRDATADDEASGAFEPP